ncbi:MAG: hypothetical protein ACTHXB_10700 [Luteimonas sp.]
MKICAYFVLSVFSMISLGVSAGNCNGDQILVAYVDSRDNDSPALDALSAAEKEKVKAMYQSIILLAEQQFVGGSAEVDSSLKMRNDENIADLFSGDRDNAVIGMNLDLLFSQMTGADRIAYVESLKGAVEALDGSSGMTIGQYNDSLNRAVVEKTLESYGCSSNLSQDYGLHAYSP